MARPRADIEAAMAAHAPYIDMLRRSRKYVASDALGPSRSARTLRSSGGEPVVTEGPYAESREVFGGFYVVDAEDLDDAIEVASRCPALETTLDHVLGLEIRPVRRAGHAPVEPARGSR